MLKLGHVTIRQKLMSIIMVTCIGALLLAGIVHALVEHIQCRKEAIRSMSRCAEMIGDNCKAALSFKDAEDAQETLTSLRAESSIVFACVYTAEGNVLAHYQNPDVTDEFSPPARKNEGYQFEDGYFKLFKDIKDKDGNSGTVYVQLDLRGMKSIFWVKMGIAALIVLMCSFVAYLVSSKLQGIVSKPILRLTEVAKDVSKKKEYSVRAIGRGDDEVGQLIDSFNEMLEQIQQRDMQLVEINQNLETRVEERTADLTREITERKRAEDALEAANRELKDFVYIASHDLREPLRKISSFGGLLRAALERKLEADDRENLDFMIDGAERMTEMIEGLLTYSRLNSKGTPFEVVDLNGIVQQLEQLELAAMLEETDTAVEVPQPLPNVKADPVQIRQLLQNLIANSIKYRRQDTAPQVVVTARELDNDKVRIEVRDNGIGIREELQKDVFRMFKRLHSRRKYEGAGIGLAVCKKIVEKHGGEIGVESKAGEGSTFWFTLSAAREPVAVS